jgi:hypothetical protein
VATRRAAAGEARKRVRRRCDGSAPLPAPIARLDQGDDLVDQRLEPSQQRGAACVADTHPHDGGSVTAEGGHVGEVLILGHDDGSMLERVAPQIAIG